MKKAICGSLLLLGASTGFCGEYSWFVDAGLTRGENNSADTEFASIAYFAAPQENGGALDEFGFLNTDTNFLASYENGDSNTYSLDGEVFINQVFVVAGYTDLDSDDETRVGIGYLFGEDLKLSFTHHQLAGDETQNVVTAAYNHSLGDLDYWGVSLKAEPDFDSWALATRYFSALSGERYFSLDAEYVDSEGEDSQTNVGVSYYFTQASSVSIFSNDGDWYMSAKHYLDQNWALKAGYQEEGEVWDLSLIGQF